MQKSVRATGRNLVDYFEKVYGDLKGRNEQRQEALVRFKEQLNQYFERKTDECRGCNKDLYKEIDVKF